MAYSNEKIVILNRQNLSDTGRLIVKQEIQDGNSSYPLQYMMVRKRSDKTWTIVNVSLNGIDLTKTFASQFRNSITRHSGNLSKVIDSWL
jgi:phospholipid transport system substrate-binding protein